MVEKGEKFGSFSIRTIQPDKTVSIRKIFCMVFYLLHSGSPSLHNPGFQSKKICHKLMKLWCFTFFTTLTRPPYFPPPQKKPKNLWKIPKCRFLKKKLPTTTAGHRGWSIFPTERRSSGSAVLLCGASVLWFQFSYGNHHCASHRNMYHMGSGSSGGFFLFGKKRCLFVVVGLAVFFFGVFDTYFSYHHISCNYHISYHHHIIIKSYITYHMSIITYHLSYIIYH